MDHVPYPKNAITPKLEIPYICDNLQDYDGLGFFNYAVRRGWCTSANREGWIDCSPAMAAKRGQNWLYFGLLREILGKRYCKEAFLKRSLAGGGFFIDTNELPEYLDHWTRTINRWKVIKGDLWRTRILERSEELFAEANIQAETLERAFVSELYEQDFGNNASNPEFFHCQKVALAVKVLLQTLRIAASKIGGLGERPSAPHSDKIPPPRIIVSQMVQRKLCSKQIQDFNDDFSAAVTFYLAALPRPVPEDNHRACSIEKCIANNVDESRYKTQHVQDHCECQFTGPEPREVRELIQRGHVPLISLGVSSSGDPELKVVKAQPGVKYTAMSHVWSGGLGNFQTNELPRCQLLYLHDVLQRLKDFKPPEVLPGSCIQWKRIQWGALPRWAQPTISIPVIRVPSFSRSDNRGTSLLRFGFPSGRPKQRVLFWMDTLCIVGEADSAVRAKAISKMALTYAAAENVLVLDPELQKITLEGLSQEQICAHVLCCAWLTRSWTMQEARLSRRWFALFADGFFDPVHPEKRANSGYELENGYYKSAGNLKAEFAREVIQWYNSMPVMRRYSVFLHPDNVIGHPLVYFIQAWNELGKRSTSKPKDALGIYANMLNLSASEVIALPHEQRMKAIFRTQETIPFHLIYNIVPKIQDPQNRWIPDFPGGYPLHLHYGVVHISTGEIELNKWTATPVGFLVDHSSPKTQKLKLTDPANAETIWVDHFENGTDVEFRAPGTTAVCYLLSDLESARLHPKYKYLGARFGVHRHEGNTVHLIYEHGFDFHLKHSMFFGMNREDNTLDYTQVEAEKIPTDQKFQLVIGKGLAPKKASMATKTEMQTNSIRYRSLVQTPIPQRNNRPGKLNPGFQFLQHRLGHRHGNYLVSPFHRFSRHRKTLPNPHNPSHRTLRRHAYKDAIHIH